MHEKIVCQSTYPNIEIISHTVCTCSRAALSSLPHSRHTLSTDDSRDARRDSWTCRKVGQVRMNHHKFANIVGMRKFQITPDLSGLIRGCGVQRS